MSANYSNGFYYWAIYHACNRYIEGLMTLTDHKMSLLPAFFSNTLLVTVLYYRWKKLN